MGAQRRNQTNVRTFRSLDGTQTTVVGVVNITYLETSAFTRQTTGSKGGHSPLVGDFGQGIGLVHELAQLIGSKEGIDHRTEGPRINQIGRGKDFVVPNIHTLADGPGHTGQTHSKLGKQLLSNRANTAVTQVVNIIHIGLGIGQLDQIFNNGYNIIPRQNTNLCGCFHPEFAVDTIATHLTQVIALIREK